MILVKQEIRHINDDKFEYAISGDLLTVTYANNVDEFDFAGVADGEINFTDIETTLPHNPIISAKKDGDILTVTVIDFTFYNSLEVQNGES